MIMQIFKVGGAVRDRLLNQPVTDIDYVVVGATPKHMLDAGYKAVGCDFPVFLHPDTKQEYALARTERKSGHGYAGFEFYTAADVTLEEDLIRRDLTINAMAEDDTGRIIDPFNGQQDLADKLLRHVSPAFAEDPLRVLRVARFAARYANLGFTVAPDTLALMQQLADSGELNHLTAERVWKEMSRALLEPRPDVFIQVLHDSRALAVLLPEIDLLFNSTLNQRHLLTILQVCAQHQQPLVIRWACLLLGIGKQITDDLLNQPSPTDLSAIKAINKRFRIPKECAEMALLVAQYHQQCHVALSLDSTDLIKMLQALDSWHRPQRLAEFCQACAMDAYAYSAAATHSYPPADFLDKAQQASAQVNSQTFIDQGLKGAAFGEAMFATRVQLLERFRASYIAP